MNAMNSSVIGKITQFKNNEIKKEDLNRFMLINLSYILHKKEKIQIKNDRIKKEQNIEIQNTLSKIKSYNGNFTFNSDELKNKPIMKKLVNPCLDNYIPMSEISYTTEIKLNKDKSGKNKFNESFLLKYEDKNDSENEEKEINFEEAPITFNKFDNERNKFNYGTNYKKLVCDNFVQLINKSDEEIISKKESTDDYSSNLFYELINSFDEGDKEDLDNDDIIFDFKKFKSSFYLDDIFNRKSVKRNSYENYRNLSAGSKSTSIGSSSHSVGGAQLVNREIYENEFSSYMPYDAFKKNVSKMSVDYLRYMLVIYSNNLSKSKKSFYMEDKMFVNLMKAFLLKIGISYKKIYEKVLQIMIINNKEKEKDKTGICSFEKFLKGFAQILNLKDENKIIKYKFILSIFRLKDENINVKHINIFMQLIKGELLFDVDLWDDLNRWLVQRYDKIYFNDTDNNFKFDKLLICLETFFDKNGKH
jgi:hypothetical protein